MDKRTERFLITLKDGRWHRKIGNGINISTALTCLHLNLVEEKLRPIGKMKGAPELPDRYLASFRITERGKKVLKNGNHPTRDEFNEATRCRRNTMFCEHRKQRPLHFPK